MTKQKHFIAQLLFVLGLMLGIVGCTRFMVTSDNANRSDGRGWEDLGTNLRASDGAASGDGPTSGSVEAGITDLGVHDVGRKDVRPRDGGLKDALPPGNWVAVSAGIFSMGSPASENCRSTIETQHQVTLTHSFVIQTTEVTQGQFQNVMGYNPSYNKQCGATCPVEQISWHEAAAYCNALSTITGQTTCYDCGGSGSSVICAQRNSYSYCNIYLCPGYRLPTEAEWEYAYRAGTTTALYNNTNVVNCMNDTNVNAIAWYGSNASMLTHPVGGKLPNNWGLYDMAGNVFEWVNDLWDVYFYTTAAVVDPCGPYSSTYGTLRGGDYQNNVANARAANRTFWDPTEASLTHGFRCVKSN